MNILGGISMRLFHYKPLISRQLGGWLTFAIVFVFTIDVTAQQRRMDQDPRLNNLVHPPGYKTTKLGELGAVRKIGSGPKDMVLIAGLGFGNEIWDGFAEKRKDRFTMYAVTLPGFGGTPAPSMPPEGTSYGEQTWTKGAQKGVENLIIGKKLKKPVIVAHWSIATQIAIGLAIERPELISRVVIISGIAKNLMTDVQFKQTVSVPQRIRYVDKGMAPQWFKTVTQDTWDDNNWYPFHYATHRVRALQLWRMAASPTLPVHIRYLCESWAQDSTVGLGELKVPMLLIKPELGPEFKSIPGQNGALKILTDGSWKGVEELSELITVKSVKNSRVFIMDDQPAALDKLVDEFIGR